MRGVRLKVRQERLEPWAARVWLNDMEISDCLVELQVELASKKLTTTRLRIVVGDVDIDAQTIAALQAYVKPSSPPHSDVGIGSICDDSPEALYANPLGTGPIVVQPTSTGSALGGPWRTM